MHVSAWFLLVYWLYAYTEFSQQCPFQHICPKEARLDRGSEIQVKEQIHHSLGHQHRSHRSRQQQHRKGKTVQPAAGLLLSLQTEAAAA